MVSFEKTGIINASGIEVDSLPSEYQEVEYIESTGTQYIDTGIQLGESNFHIKCDFEEVVQTSQEQAIFSIWTGQHNYWNCFIRSKDLDVYTSGHHYFSNVINVGERNKVELTRSGNQWALYNGVSSITWSYTPASVNNTTIKLFRRGDLPGIANSNTHIKMYSWNIIIGGELAMTMIPCYRKSDLKPGMYDPVSGTFFAGQGTDEFTLGSEVSGNTHGFIETGDLMKVFENDIWTTEFIEY